MIEPRADADSIASAERFAATSMGSPLRLTLTRAAAHGQGFADGATAASVRAWDETQDEFAQADKAMSRFSATSELTRLNRSAGSGRAIPVGRRVEMAVVAADRARRVTGGRFDPRVLDDLESLGEHGADLGRRRFREARPRDWSARPLLCRPGPGRLAIDRPIDLGGIGKGLALRWAARRIERAGCSDFLLDAGGDLVVRGAAPEGGPWQVGIEDALGGPVPAAVIAPPSGAAATSSIRRRSWLIGDRQVHHLLDPATGLPAWRGLQAVTVTGPDPAWAEVWSKALFIGGLVDIADAARRRGLAAWWISDDGSLAMTPAARSITVWVRAEAD